ncbi:helix-turn-helix transcriptional regulator [Mammaliicoccus sciuri]|uniref:helix-turn-helix transcriptional regulator n=1 Tax=Mammaliicoccus sciuri TaxID=1296 RepID=UPI001953EF4F|nr:WYL domain-containing protein [Mammaliicoccus sciuri]MCJ1765470.1 WYL domain-containing protein [Mammaliicoccus sciuri]MCJ1773854.1 WYL domain-containing protein [Mammaliicoccus sciuri]
MKSDRLFKILNLLESRDVVSTRIFAERLNVSDRTIRRDMDSLSLMGYPIVSKRGANGGWYLLNNFKSSIKTLTEDEINLLTIGPSQQLLTDLNFYDQQLSLENKLNHVEFNKYVHIDTSNWFDELQRSSLIRVIYQNIKRRKKISIKYCKRNEETKIYKIDCLGIVLNIDEWYLVGKKKNESIRVFKVSRIDEIYEENEVFEYPKEFSLKDTWIENKNNFKKIADKYKVNIIINQKDMELIEKSFRIESYKNQQDNLQQLTLIFDNLDTAKRNLSGFMDIIKDIQCKELKNIINRHIKLL